jgi:large exoprotein involved in heme utilization and adhesion
VNLFSFSISLNGTSGQGGNITLTAKNQITGLEVLTASSSGQSGTVQMTGVGDLFISNTLILTSKQVTLQICPNCSEIQVPVGDKGQSGDVFVTSTGNLTFNNSSIQSDTKSSDPAGNVIITSPGLITFNNSQIVSNTSNTGLAGNVSVRADQGVTVTDGSLLSATTSSSGSAGSITLDTPTLNVVGNARIVAETQGEGRGGNILINAPTVVNLTRLEDFFPILSVEASGSGKAGDILINTPNLNLSDRARITATATATATNPEGGGSITLNASNLNLAGIVGVFAETQGQAPAGTLTLNPYLNQLDLNIALTRNSQISASTSGSGNGGDLLVSAPRSITITEPGRLAVETSGTGNAGNMTFATRQLTLTDGVELSASTFGAGRAGEVQINAEDLTIAGGARILTNTAGSGQAGDLIINVIDRLLLTDPGTGLFASTTPGSTGNGGNIIIDPRLVQIEDGATIAVNSQGSGTGGSISLRAGRLELRDRGSITAETASAQGGNITLDVQDLILLRRNSLVSATAGTGQTVGDGGNITIRSPFIIGVLRENSDITANAFTGRGGNIAITTNAIFGLLPQARLTPLSDITARSEFGLSGTIAITDLNVDPNRGLVTLPTNLTDTSRQIREACTPGSAAIAGKNSFVVVGRGGLPASPEAAQTGDRPLVDLVSPVPASTTQATSPQPAPSDAADRAQATIVEAQTWTTATDGTVFLTAHTNSDSVPPPGIPLPTCISR